MIVRRTNRKNANNGKYISGEKIIKVSNVYST